MKHAHTLIVVATILVAFVTSCAHTPPLSPAADPPIVRLLPSAIPGLPPNIARILEKRHCTIPQSYAEPAPHNVIRGQFQTPGQMDWAVLCSDGVDSFILVFWRGTIPAVAEIARAPDANFIEQGEDGKPRYCRRIDPVGQDYIMQHYQRYGGPEPPPIDHQGIDDIYVGKASVVRYWHKDHWLELTGAD